MGDDTLGMTYEMRRQARGAEPPKEPRRWRRRLLVGGIVLVCVGGAVGAFLTWRAVAYVRTTKARVWADLRDVSPEVDGVMLERLVNTGDKVVKGQVLARLDDTEIRAALEAAKATMAVAESQYAQAEAQVEVAAARLASADAAVRLREAQVAEEIRRAEADAKQAQAWLDRVEKGARPEQIQAAEARLATAKALQELYALEVRQSEQLVEEGIDSQHILEVKKTQLATQKNAVREAELELALLRAGATEEEVEAQRQAVAARQAALALARAGSEGLEGLKADLETREAELTLAQKGVETAIAQLGRAQTLVADVLAELEDCTIKSPLTGTVHRTFDDEGEFCRRGVTTMIIADDSKGRWVQGLIREKDRKHVKEGQPARVKVAGARGWGYFRAEVVSVSDSTYSATSSRSSSPEESEGFGLPGQYRVKLRLLEQPEEDWPGTSARALIRVW